mmetsp:Transcript_59763/g.156720  ORF Transcript_59763/g.156720 Transcript_59763/m.156720 type:complete len:204 (+) Transcript_59763:389-1000(+)
MPTVCGSSACGDFIIAFQSSPMLQAKPFRCTRHCSSQARKFLRNHLQETSLLQKLRPVGVLQMLSEHLSRWYCCLGLLDIWLVAISSASPRTWAQNLAWVTSRPPELRTRKTKMRRPGSGLPREAFRGRLNWTCKTCKRQAAQSHRLQSFHRWAAVLLEAAATMEADKFATRVVVGAHIASRGCNRSQAASSERGKGYAPTIS